MSHEELQNQSAPPTSWAARLRLLEALLAQSPDSAQAWHWRVQIKILRFLVARYGDVNLPPAMGKSVRTPLSDLMLPKRLHTLKTSSALRNITSRIRERNANKRYADVPHDFFKPRKLSPWNASVSELRQIYPHHRWKSVIVLMTRYTLTGLAVFSGAIFLIFLCYVLFVVLGQR